MQNLLLSKNRITHSIKTALACIIGFITTKFIHFPTDQWLVITILVVMCAQINVGSMLQKSYMRFLGTLLGSIVAGLTLWFLGSNTLATGIVLTLSAFFFSYMATGQSNASEAGTLGAVTVAIILIGQHPTITIAAERFTEISLGILIAALVSQFILPIHARNLLRSKQIETLTLLRSYYLATFLTNQSDDNRDYQTLDENIITLLLPQRKLAKEALQEPFSKKNIVVSQFYNMLWCEREMQRAITFMHHAYKSSPESKKIFSESNVTTEFHDKITAAFETIIKHMQNRTLRQLEINIPTLSAIEEVIALNKTSLNSNDLMYTSVFLFCAGILIDRMHDLVRFIRQ